MKKLNIAIFAGILSLFLLVPVSFANSANSGLKLNIDTTGAKSKNSILIKNTCINNVKQSNKSEVANQVMVDLNTGSNSASKNTGSGTVVTGDASAVVLVHNSGNSNELESNNCCCEQSTKSSFKVSNTGYKSSNVASVVSSSKTTKLQKNVSAKLNAVGVMLNTGLNKTDKNTGDGESETGSTEVLVEIHNEGDSNTLD